MQQTGFAVLRKVCEGVWIIFLLSGRNVSSCTKYYELKSPSATNSSSIHQTTQLNRGESEGNPRRRPQLRATADRVNPEVQVLIVPQVTADQTRVNCPMADILGQTSQEVEVHMQIFRAETWRGQYRLSG